jgi:hypothetical protein
MDLAAIQGAIAGLKAATDISSALLSMKVTGEVQAKVIELQSALLTAQNAALAATTAQFELHSRVRELEIQLQQQADWEATRRRYRLVTPWRGAAQTYALLRADAQGESPHLACPACFHNRRIAILNPMNNRERWVQMVCPVCKASMETGFRGIGPPKYAEEYEAQKDGEG